MLKLFFMLAGLVPALLSAQVVEFDFPSCRYLDYVFAIKYGSRLDTIAKGRIDDFGKASFTIPSKYASYRGVAKLSIDYCKPNINLIMGGEAKIALSEKPNSGQDEFIVEVSHENKALLSFIDRQKQIISQYNALGDAQNQTMIFALPGAKAAALVSDYKKLLQEIRQSPLYAARIIEMMVSLAGLGDEPGMPQQEILQSQQKFIRDRIDFKDLYTSGFWQPMTDLWFQTVSANDSLLLDDARHMLSRTEDIPIRRELTNTIIRQLSRYGKDNLLVELGSEYLTIPINGMPAPELATGSEPLKPGKSLILFYDPQCGNCHYELRRLTEKYPLLSESHNRMQIISVSADTDKDNFESVSQKFPWADKICDFKGIDGENFNNYGIVGTPTYILVDEDGIIRGRYAQLSEFLKD